MNIVIDLIDSCVGEKIAEKNLKGRVSNFHALQLWTHLLCCSFIFI